MNHREVFLRREVKRLEIKADLLTRLVYGLAGPEPVAIPKRVLEGKELKIHLDLTSDPNHVMIKRVSPPPVLVDKVEVCDLCGVPQPPGEECPACGDHAPKALTLEEQLELPLRERS